jgi:predicted MFS family arabinose efflux permease
MAWPFAAETICAVAAVLLFARVVVPPTPSQPGERQHIWHDIREGLTWTRHNPAMLALVIQILTFNVTFGASWSVLVLFSQERLGMGNVGFGILSAVAAVGGLLGNVTYPWVERHVSLANIMRYGLVLETFTHLILAVTTSPIIAMLIMFFFGIHEANWGTTAMSVRQRAVPNELLGRVGGVYQVAMMGGLVVGSLIGGLLATHFGLLAPYWFGFFGCAVMLIAIWSRLGDIAHQDAQSRDDDTHLRD